MSCQTCMCIIIDFQLTRCKLSTSVSSTSAYSVADFDMDLSGKTPLGNFGSLSYTARCIAGKDAILSASCIRSLTDAASEQFL